MRRAKLEFTLCLRGVPIRVVAHSGSGLADLAAHLRVGDRAGADPRAAVVAAAERGLAAGDGRQSSRRVQAEWTLAGAPDQDGAYRTIGARASYGAREREEPAAGNEG